MEKDDIISQQWELIRTITENNLNNVGNDLWGAPPADFSLPKPKAQNSDAGKADKDGAGNAPTPATQGANPDAEAEKAAAEEEEAPPENIEDLKAELDTYIGLDSVKDEVHDLINLVTIYNMRKQHDLPTVDMSLHLVFSGNPGTGKTMMARMMARIYKSLGMLSKGQLIEVDRSGLVAGYVGQTAIKTSEVIQKAMGGVLFIDEAYALSNKAENDFGQEAIDTILKAMEDHRDDLVIIVAGYVDLMEEFIHSNPGLESRFNRYLYFEDYSVDEMMQIFDMRCKKSCYELDDKAKDALRAYFLMKSLEDQIAFGNARGVRNTFEKILVHQANRLSKLEKVEKADLLAITEADVLELMPKSVQEKAAQAAAQAAPESAKSGDDVSKKAKDEKKPDSIQLENAENDPETGEQGESDKDGADSHTEQSPQDNTPSDK